MDFNLNIEMTRLIKILFLVTTISIVLNGCYHDNEEDLYPTLPGCDTTDLSFSKDVLPILNNYCFTCHGNDAYLDLGSGISLDGYDNVMLLVEPNNYLLSAIQQDGNAIPMPKSGEKLSDCNIAIIRGWINEGAKNN